MIKKIVLVVCFFSSYFLFAQLTNNGLYVFPQIFTPSPNAATLGNYGNYSVDLFTGQPSIGINLFDLQIGSYKLPVNLNYSLSSVRPEEHPGWVGLGWGLNVGGAITRLVRGGVDEVLVGNFTDSTIFSYYDHFSRLDHNNWDNDTNLWSLLHDMTSLFPSSHFIEFPSPDEFIFNINGLSGSFFKNHKGKWIVKANKNIDIKIIDTIYRNFSFNDCTYSDSPEVYTYNIGRIIYGFELTTADGYKYIFGKTPNSIEFDGLASNYPYDFYYPNMVAKTWYITKIITPETKEIIFNYKTNTETPVGHDPNQDMVYHKAVFKQNVSNYYMAYYFSSNNYINSRFYSYPKKKLVNRIFPVYLDNIVSSNFTLKFHKSFSNEMDYTISSSYYYGWDFYNDYSGGYLIDYESKKHWHKLDSIVLFDKFNKKVKTCEFSYRESMDSRLFLNKIKESAQNTTDNKEYAFEYNPINLPPYASGKVDHWGFYNNNLYNGGWDRNSLENNYFNSKNPNPNVLKAGTLEKISYPTGGWSIFTYEPNEYYKYVNRSTGGFSINTSGNENQIAGGLRIKKITSYDNNTISPLETDYIYVNDFKNGDFTSSGVLSGIPKYIEKDVEIGDNYTFNLNDNPFVFLNDTNGNHITYTKVIEKNSNNGYKEFTFSNHDNGYIDNVPNNVLLNKRSYSSALNGVNLFFLGGNSMKTAYNKRDMERGNLLNEKIYNNSNQLLEETIYHYSSSSLNNSDTEIRFIDLNETTYGEQFVDMGAYKFFTVDFVKREISANKIKSDHLFLNKTENYKYDLTNNLAILTTKEYTYSNQIGFHQLKTETLSLSATNENKLTTFSYAPELAVSSNNCLINNNMVGIPLKTETYKNGEKIAEQKTEYANDSSTSGLCLPKYVYTKKGNETTLPLEKKITYDLYDNKGNLKQYTPENAPPVSIVWGYNQTQPVAKIEGIAYNSINVALITAIQTATDSATATENDVLTALNNLRSSLPVSTMVTTYTYKPLIGVSTIMDPKGQITYYEYDNFNRLWHIKDHNLNILQTYHYNYKGVVYQNIAKSQNFIRNDCAINKTGSSITYSVAAGAYTSTISQSDADAMAQMDINTNGQNYANTHGTCNPIDFNYTETTDPYFHEITITVTSSSPNHNGATYKFRIDYDTQSGSNQSEYVDVVLPAGETSFSTNFLIGDGSYGFATLLELIIY